MALSTEDLPAGAEKRKTVQAMFDRIADRYDLVNTLLTFGLHKVWRRRSLRDVVLTDSMVVADLACGTGDYCELLSSRGVTAIGLDLSTGMLLAGHQRLPDALFCAADGTTLPLGDASVDGLTCGFALRNFVSLADVLADAHRVVKPGGFVVLLDVAAPKNPVLAWGHSLWFRKGVPFVGGLLSDKWAYSYLPASTAYLPPADGLVQVVRDAGFVKVEHTFLTGGIVQLIVARRPA